MIVEKSNQELRDDCASDYFQNIVETVRKPLLLPDLHRYQRGDGRSASRRILLPGQPEPKDKDVEVNCRINERAAYAFSKWCNGFLTNRQARGDGTVNSSGASVL